MYLRRYCVTTNRDGARAYDLYETMNRQAYFRDNGRYRWDAATLNIETLMRIRSGEQNAMDARFYNPIDWNQGERLDRRHCVHPFFWFARHGVEVSMNVYDEQEWEIQAIEDATEVEAAHALWNLWDDGEASQEATVDSDLSDITDQEIEEMLQDAIGNLDGEVEE